MRRFFLGTLLFISASSSWAADICVGSTARGAGNGADWNNVAQWSTMTFVRGNSYYLEDGTYGSKTCSTAQSGSTKIFIKKATLADHVTDTGWSSTMGDGQAVLGSLTISTGYWTIDGNRGGTGAWDATNPGSFGFLINVSSGNVAIGCPNFPRDLSFINIDINGPGFRVTTSETNAIKMAYPPDSPILNTLISRCRFQNMDTMLKLSNLQNAVIEYSTFRFCSSGNLSAVHPDTMYVTLGDGMTVRYCFFGDVDAESIFYEYGATNQVYYGNVMVQGTGENSTAIELKQGYTWGVFKLYNNTFVGWERDVVYRAPAAAGSETKNNIFDNCANDTAGAISSFNGYRGVSAVGSNATTSSTNPFVNTAGLNYRLNEGSWPINAGTVLSAPYNQDMDGTTRGIGAWDLGAYEFGAVEPDTIPPTPNPMTFASNPAAMDSVSVAMTATTASDATPPVEYFFDETSGNAGGGDSGWQSEASYTNSGLSASTLYTYRVKARDALLNETAYSSASSATTSAAPAGKVNASVINVDNLRVTGP